jgi:hypothetical protein
MVMRLKNLVAFQFPHFANGRQRFFSAEKLSVDLLLDTAKDFVKKGDLKSALSIYEGILRKDRTCKVAYENYLQVALMNNNAFGPTAKGLDWVLKEYHKMFGQDDAPYPKHF